MVQGFEMGIGQEIERQTDSRKTDIDIFRLTILFMLPTQSTQMIYSKSHECRTEIKVRKPVS